MTFGEHATDFLRQQIEVFFGFLFASYIGGYLQFSDSISTFTFAEGNTALVGQSVAELTDAGFNISSGYGWASAMIRWGETPNFSRNCSDWL